MKLALLAILIAHAALAGPTFRVTFDEQIRAEPASGRLVIYLIKHGADIPPGTPPASGPFWHDPQPMYGVWVDAASPGRPITIDNAATYFPAPLDVLAPGTYDAQAVLDMHELHSSWRMEPGNLLSAPVTFTVSADDPDPIVAIELTEIVGQPEPPPLIQGVEIVEIRSTLLSEFRGRDVVLRAGVVLPLDHNPSRRYPAIYEVPGFGGDHYGAYAHAVSAQRAPSDSPRAALARAAFWIVLDPESGNGHTLFADSDNNGPVGRALITELIPAIEQRFNLIPQPSARLLRGHSSGGWSTLWLTVTYPEVFGGCWSSAPDPVDFRRFQLVDIYAKLDGPTGAPNQIGSMYYDQSHPPKELNSYRSDGQNLMSIRQENLMEEVIGPDNASAQQWDSWQAVFGPRNAAGRPAAMYDPHTGRIDPAIAHHYRRFDISHRFAEEPAKYLPIFRDRVRLVVGDQDNFHLEQAVMLLSKRIDDAIAAMPGFTPRSTWTGYIRIVPGYDHGSIHDSPEVQAFIPEILAALGAAGHLVADAPIKAAP